MITATCDVCGCERKINGVVPTVELSGWATVYIGRFNEQPNRTETLQICHDCAARVANYLQSRKGLHRASEAVSQ